MNNTEILNSLFSNPEFLSSNKDCEDYESIYTSVVAIAPSVTMDELKAYLETVSKGMSTGDELSDTELDNVAGGGGITIWVVITAVSGCYAIGEGIGKFIYNITHRK